MALFKFRKGGDEPMAAPAPAESIEAMRKRARHRLIGAVVLVLVGIIGFPVLFDTQPRPVAVDIPIEIPDRNKAKPLPAPAVRPAQPPAAAGPITSPSAPSKVAAAAPAPSEKPSAAPASAAKPEVAAEKTEAKPDEAARARALLEGKPVQVAAASEAG